MRDSDLAFADQGAFASVVPTGITKVFVNQGIPLHSIRLVVRFRPHGCRRLAKSIGNTKEPRVLTAPSSSAVPTPPHTTLTAVGRRRVVRSSRLSVALLRLSGSQSSTFNPVLLLMSMARLHALPLSNVARLVDSRSLLPSMDLPGTSVAVKPTMV